MGTNALGKAYEKADNGVGCQQWRETFSGPHSVVGSDAPAGILALVGELA